MIDNMRFFSWHGSDLSCRNKIVEFGLYQMSYLCCLKADGRVESTTGFSADKIKY